MLGYARGPGFDFVARNLNGIAALIADQMVMVFAGATLPVDGFAVGRAEDIDLARGRESLEVPVHGRQADAPTLGFELVVELLRGSEPLSSTKCLLDGRPLLGRPLGPSRVLVHVLHHTTARARAKTLARTKATIAAITIVAPGGAFT